MALNTLSAQPPGQQQLDPDSLEQWLSILVAAYHRSRASLDAWEVSHCIQALIQHPDYEGSDEDRCAYGRLSRQWGWLAQSRPCPAAVNVTAMEVA